MKTLLILIVVSFALIGSGIAAKAGVQQWAAVKLAPVALAFHR